MVVIALTLCIARLAAATPNFPGAVQRDLGASEVPACSICHLCGITGRGTVNTPWGMAMRARGLVEFNETSLAAALAAMQSDRVDSDGDGVIDVDAVRTGKDPNPPGLCDEQDETIPRYGCVGRVSRAPARSGAWSWALLVGALFAVRRRMLRRMRSVGRIGAKLELGPTDKSIADGLLFDLVAALRSTAEGDLVGLTVTGRAMADDLERWARLTGNSIVGVSVEREGTRFVVRRGSVAPDEPPRRIGERLWLYSNFDCNLACAYCCVRSSPHAPRRELGLARVARIAEEAKALDVREIFLTGGEPFLLADIGPILRACAEAAPTTVLTNGMLFKGSRLDALRELPRERVTLQISIDSPDPRVHDENRGAGSWARAMAGLELAKGLGFRVRWAATVKSEHDERSIERFLDQRNIVSVDRVVRRTALRGFAREGVALARVDLVPEVTLTARGVFYHPVGADDDDFLVSTDIFPLAAAIEAVERTYVAERAHRTSMATIFNCA
jgi:organic radical activating enzyme